ncbi:unnamed protein product [Trichobilharzia regenti]|nr:unnamed protein product [Trichobilharzia regenti]
MNSFYETVDPSEINTVRLNETCKTTTAVTVNSASTAPSMSVVISHESVSPTLNRMRNEVQQLARWLTTIGNVLETSQAKLGDRFDQETESQQLQFLMKEATDGLCLLQIMISLYSGLCHQPVSATKRQISKSPDVIVDTVYYLLTKP